MAGYIWLLLGFMLQVATCSKILALFTVPSHSHHLWAQVYFKALTSRGHEVTYVGVDKYDNPPPNIRHILIEDLYEEIYEQIDITAISNTWTLESMWQLNLWYDQITSNSIQREGFKKFMEIVKTEKFDLVVIDLGTTPFLLGAVDVLGRPPIVGITAFGYPPWAMDLAGTPYPIVNTHHFLAPLAQEMNFWQRLQNAGFYLYSRVLREMLLSNEDAASRQVFGPNVRPLKDILAEISVNMVNINWALDSTFPATPGLIPVSGLHIKETKPLPKDLQQFLDSSREGVIYFSLGTNIQSSILKDHEIKALLSAFKEIAPVKVLWKWEKDEISGKPDNVKTSKWLPQNDILAHPNIKLFFTHGGMLSSQEAVYHGVPTVGMPIFLDQHVNVNKAVLLGYGERQDLSQISKESLVNTLKKVLNNPSYKKRALELSKVFKDKINSPLDTAVYWTEYAMRHNGANHLQPPSQKLYWFQSSLLDIYFIGLLIISLIILTIFKLFKLIFKFICGQKKIKTQ